MAHFGDITSNFASPDICAQLDADSAPVDLAQSCYDNGWPMTGAGSTTACVASGNAASAAIDAKKNDVASTWNPPTTFTGGQIRSVVAGVYSMLDQATQMLQQTSVLGSDAANGVKNELDEVARHKAQADLYVQAAQDADTTGQAVSAPAFKQWIVNAMGEASNGITAAVAYACIQPWWGGAVQGLSLAAAGLWGIIKATVGIAVAVGQGVITAVETAVTAAGFLATTFRFITQWWPLLAIAVATGGYAMYRKRTYGRIIPESMVSKIPVLKALV